MHKTWIPLQRIAATIGLLILIFDSRQALAGARSGIELCFKTVIPSLFPFFVLSMIFTQSLGDGIPKIVLRCLKIPQEAASVLVSAFLGGYPIGAKCVADLYRNGKMSKDQAERLLGFCSNAGPSFVFGMLSGFFPDRKMVWLLWIIHICSAVLTAISIPAEAISCMEKKTEKQCKAQSIMLSSATAMCMVCCWVILFRMILYFLQEWFFWILPVWIQVLLSGILELTNGCCELLLITDVPKRFLICSCMLAWGGICVLLQTAAVTEGLDLAYYVKGKLMQTGFSFLISCLVIMERRVLTAGLIPLLVILFRKMQNRDRNLTLLPV